MRPSIKAGAAVVVLAVAVGLWAFLTVGGGGATITWADVQREIREARTLTFTATMEQNGVPAMVVRGMAKGTVSRQEMSKPYEMIVIMDIAKKKVLSIETKEKTAVLTSISQLPEAARKRLEEGDYFGHLKKLIEKAGVEIGEKTIDGRQAKGYRVGKGGRIEMTLWADAKTGHPIVMEFLQYGGRVKTVIKDFELDKKLDDSLFSFQPPEGFELIKLDLKSARTEDMTAFLRLWVDARKGTFPDTLSEVEWIKDCVDAVDKLSKELPKEQLQELLETLGRARLFLQLHPDRYGYAGKGVKMGDAKTPVFWFCPDGETTYIVVYGDLSTKAGVPAKDLPKPPATKPAPAS
ncbi:MAG TPA: hypothetical protein VM695_07030 [Phycisphaerae bacterium]|nr:hypothetical protein [Phycisphaerae bacterium]